MPMFDSRAARATWTVLVIVLALLAAYRVRQTLFVFVIAILFAYLLFPLMDLIFRRFPAKTRTPALAVTFLLVLAMVGSLLGFIGTVAVQQGTTFAKAAPAFIERAQQAEPPAAGAVESVRQRALRLLGDQFRAHYDDIVSVIPRVSLQVLSASRNLVFLIIIPILSFFILRDGREIRDAFLDLVPTRRAGVEDVLADIHLLLLQYMRALLLLSCSTFIVFATGLSLLGVSYPILLAAIAFLFEFVPLLGPLAAALIVLAVSAASGYPHLLFLLLFLGLFRMLQDYALSPALMSHGVELHPLAVIFGVFAGAEIGGVAGVFLAVPVLAAARLLYRHLKRRALTSQT